MNAASTSLPHAVLFDLDGTLIDSAPDIHAAVVELLATRALPALSLAQATAMIGNGVNKLVERAFAASGTPLDEADLKQAISDMLPIYNRHLTGLTRLMPGVPDVLHQLRDSGVQLALVTNKPQAATDEVLAHFGLTELFGAVLGGDAVSRKKPDPEALYLAMDHLGTDASNTVMVGDSAADVQSARNAGVRAIAIRGGYTNVPAEQLGADLTLDSLAELFDALQNAPTGTD